MVCVCDIVTSSIGVQMADGRCIQKLSCTSMGGPGAVEARSGNVYGIQVCGAAAGPYDGQGKEISWFTVELPGDAGAEGMWSSDRAALVHEEASGTWARSRGAWKILGSLYKDPKGRNLAPGDGYEGFGSAVQRELEMEKNSEVKRAQLGVVPGWVTFLGSLPTGTIVGPVCWLGRHEWYQSLTQPEVQELSATQDKVLRYGSHLLKP
ncbi:hypothetical protein Taro_051870 [Colocasia esculenta]|uniref:Uncharacterized protein n=1 Tax=Colocasia esculenta TaxID=4460 RepID=A0A843XI39_COLES|nr:hypothetical protein [Colocasia esculenta]